MITIHITRNREGMVRRFNIKGHAGYAEHGSDIVCAAVSITAYNAVGALAELAGLKRIHTEKDGFMDCQIPDDVPEEKKQTVRIILDTTVVGFRQIARQYKKYVKVLEEVN